MEEKKKSKVGVIILIIILLLLIGFGVWYFVLRDKGTNKPDNGNNTNNTEENTNTNNENTMKEELSEFNYTEGILHEIGYYGEQPLFTIDGIILVGNRHEYRGENDSMEIIDFLVEKGYKKDEINSSFYLGEWIEFYIDTKYDGPTEDVKILVVSHKPVEEYLKLSLSSLEEYANTNGGFVLDYQKPDEENHKYVGSGYINADYPEGKYDILFAYKGKLVYYICIDLTKEPTE